MGTNPKPEARNPKETRNPKSEGDRLRAWRAAILPLAVLIIGLMLIETALF